MKFCANLFVGGFRLCLLWFDISGFEFDRRLLVGSVGLMMSEGGEGGEFPPKKGSQESADFPVRKLARQLDFTAGFGGVSSSAVALLPDHPQATSPSPAALVHRHQEKLHSATAAPAPAVPLVQPPLTTVPTRPV